MDNVNERTRYLPPRFNQESEERLLKRHDLVVSPVEAEETSVSEDASRFSHVFDEDLT